MTLHRRKAIKDEPQRHKGRKVKKSKKDMKEPDTYTNQLSHSVIGAAIEVHRALGAGFLESVYEEALCRELSLRNIAFEQQYKIGVEYKGKLVGEQRLDILVDRCLIVELKVVDRLDEIHHAQIISQSSRLHLGLLINFNAPVLKMGIRRIVSSD